MSIDSILRCPLCRAPFTRDVRALTCSSGHAFDLAREGYVNLMRGKRTGDSLEMLRARRAFLEAGHYRLLADTLADLVSTAVITLLGTQHSVSVMDAGCGEGYYLARIIEALGHAGLGTRAGFLALDASKDAVRLTARRCRSATCVVADLQEELPIADSSLHVLLNIFAPRRLPEFARVLIPGGSLFIVIPAPDHLSELRQELNLLGIEEQKEERLVESLSGQFELVRRFPLRHDLQVDEPTLHNLLHMTPNHLHPERLAGSERLIGRTVRASFVILECRKNDLL